MIIVIGKLVIGISTVDFPLLLTQKPRIINPCHYLGRDSPTIGPALRPKGCPQRETFLSSAAVSSAGIVTARANWSPNLCGCCSGNWKHKEPYQPMGRGTLREVVSHFVLLTVTCYPQKLELVESLWICQSEHPVREWKFRAMNTTNS